MLTFTIRLRDPANDKSNPGGGGGGGGGEGGARPIIGVLSPSSEGLGPSQRDHSCGTRRQERWPRERPDRSRGRQFGHALRPVRALHRAW